MENIACIITPTAVGISQLFPSDFSFFATGTPHSPTTSIVQTDVGGYGMQCPLN